MHSPILALKYPLLFWVFPVSGNNPSLYTPLLAQPHPLLPVEGALLSALPSAPARRRKPILAVLDLLQRRYNLHPSDGDKETFENSTSNANGETSTDQSVKNETSNGNGGSAEKDFEGGNPGKAYQIARIYALLDTLMKDHPDTNDGFSYAFKYQVPTSSSKLENVKVSVQQNLQRFPQVEDNPLHNRVYKTPLDYHRVQDEVDAVVQDSEHHGSLNTAGVFGPLLLSQYSLQQENKERDLVGKDHEEAEEESRLRPTKLMLRPVAKAVAGPRGIAVASPMAKAVLRRGQPVTLEYEPDAVAIAGPGGRAHAHPEFSVDYIESQETAK